MVFNCFKPQDPNRRASKELDKKIAGWMKSYRKSIKLLLLGAGESGKTTIIKQMKILHVKGFTLEEKKEKAQEIKRNILESIWEITNNMGLIKPPVMLENSENQESLDFIRSIDLNANYNFPAEFFNHTKRLWDDEGVQNCYKRSSEFYLIDCAKYFLDRVEAVSKSDYLPSDQDVLRSRKRTSDIQKIEFEVKIPFKYGGGTQVFWMFDVGGQRGERRKWIQVFDGITAVLFLVASSGYDMKIREDNETNRLQESINLFGEVWSSRFLRDSGFILFLNKQDVLREKIEKGIKLEDHFPDFESYQTKESEGTEGDEYIKARSFIKEKFLNITKKHSEDRRYSTDNEIYDNYSHCERECFWHYTTATDTDNIKKVFDSVHSMIIIWNLKKVTPT